MPLVSQNKGMDSLFGGILMKKILKITSLVLLVTILSTTVAFAQQGKANFNGEVIQVNADGTLNVQLQDGTIVTVHPAAGETFDPSLVGTMVHVKGTYNTDGSVQADWVKAVGSDDDDDDGDGQGKGKGQEKNKAEGEGSKENSAYCSGDKDSDHPFAASIADTYGVDVSEVTAYFCQGYGFGQIMLALQTGQMEGATNSVADMLAARESGMGWGQIWKEMGLIGNADHGKSPPGLLKKVDKTTGPPEGKGWKKDEGE
jgi:hypothetical protein